ncbi:efflux RND transporter periplasmic adaptor subunit [Sphingomonas sp. H160509]|uniref:efflux RND transporter periplasmic adaptor subunit n=1 Tax=Sphingomonas sp. H160509 TaxID=2955313 RepID=UPI0020974825|nr:efflux RND transporter periplasmic adaptor subunit [Sphingomonas sp. H160509]MDD1451399.1 efflux RND transporter periplasmic adaptor subunit [Sphingomonas sp. H160509]
MLLASCSNAPKTAAPHDPARVGIVTLTSGPVTTTQELTGRTNPTTESDVRPQVDGIILARLFREGTYVRAGQPLYRIDPSQFRASRDQAAATLENSQATYAAAQAQASRYGSLTDPDAVSKQQFDNTVAAAREARATIHLSAAALEAARINLGYTLIRAPISGRISRSAVTPGALVTASQATALATIQQLDPIYVDLVQSSDALLTLRRALAKGSVLPSSTTVTLKLPDGSSYPHPGTVEFTEVTVDENAGTVTLRARFPNPEGLLLPGMFVRVAAPQGVTPNGILAPQQGITRDPKGNATALVLGAGNTVVATPVIAAQAVGEAWLVTRGLKRGDRLIVDGTDNAVPGSVVRPIPVRLPTLVQNP